jgi:hypothetical protein
MGERVVSAAPQSSLPPAQRGLEDPAGRLHSPGGVSFARNGCSGVRVERVATIVSKRLGSRSGNCRDWIKSKNPMAPAVKREAEEEWGKEQWR